MKRIISVAKDIYRLKASLPAKPIEPVKGEEGWQLDAILAKHTVDDILKLQSFVSKELNLLELDGTVSNTLTFFAAFQILIEPYRRYFQENYESEKWKQPKCPFCGKLAGIAHINSAGIRKLVCHFCWTEWIFSRLKCPFCEGENTNYALFEMEEGNQVRVDYCNDCGCYIKTVIFDHSLEPYVVWDLKTLSLDDWAIMRNYKRPTPTLAWIDFTK